MLLWRVPRRRHSGRSRLCGNTCSVPGGELLEKYIAGREGKSARIPRFFFVLPPPTGCVGIGLEGGGGKRVTCRRFSLRRGSSDGEAAAGRDRDLHERHRGFGGGGVAETGGTALCRQNNRVFLSPGSRRLLLASNVSCRSCESTPAWIFSSRRHLTLKIVRVFYFVVSRLAYASRR